MAEKGSLWCASEVQFLLDIWADGRIQEQLDTTHNNSEIYSKICGFQRTTKQLRQKGKKLRARYMKEQNALHKSGSSSDEKDQIHWYDAVDNIIGCKPMLESHEQASTDSAPFVSNKEETGLARLQSSE